MTGSQTDSLVGAKSASNHDSLLLLMDVGAVRAQRNELVMATTFSPGAIAWIIQRWQTEPESVMIRTLNRTSASLEQLLDTANVENVDLIPDFITNAAPAPSGAPETGPV